MNVVVLGANGYLGARITENVSLLSHVKLTGVTRSQFPQRKASKSPFVTYIRYNDSDGFRAALSAADVIIHAAGPNSTFSVANPTKALAECQVLARKVMSSISDRRQPLLIFLSTVHVYSEVLCGELDERTEVNNTHPYALSRRLAEDVFLRQSTPNKIRPLIIRLGNIFGSPSEVVSEGWNLAPNQFCLQAIIKKHIVLRNPKNPRRHYTPISLLLSFISEAILDKKDLPSLINFVSDKSMLVSELAELVATVASEVLMDKVSVSYPKDLSVSSHQHLHIKSIHLKTIRCESDSLRGEIKSTLLYIKRNMEHHGAMSFEAYLEAET